MQILVMFRQEQTKMIEKLDLPDSVSYYKEETSAAMADGIKNLTIAIIGQYPSGVFGYGYCIWGREGSICYLVCDSVLSHRFVNRTVHY